MESVRSNLALKEKRGRSYEQIDSISRFRNSIYPISKTVPFSAVLFFNSNYKIRESQSGWR
jgi:hypothetical protein